MPLTEIENTRRIGLEKRKREGNNNQSIFQGFGSSFWQGTLTFHNSKVTVSKSLDVTMA
jgi:hypothetical protein